MASINYKWGIIKDGNEVTPFMYDSIDIAGMRYRQRRDKYSDGNILEKILS